MADLDCTLCNEGLAGSNKERLHPHRKRMRLCVRYAINADRNKEVHMRSSVRPGEAPKLRIGCSRFGASAWDELGDCVVSFGNHAKVDDQHSMPAVGGIKRCQL